LLNDLRLKAPPRPWRPSPARQRVAGERKENTDLHRSGSARDPHDRRQARCRAPAPRARCADFTPRLIIRSSRPHMAVFCLSSRHAPAMRVREPADSFLSRMRRTEKAALHRVNDDRAVAHHLRELTRAHMTCHHHGEAEHAHDRRGCAGRMSRGLKAKAAPTGRVASAASPPKSAT